MDFLCPDIERLVACFTCGTQTLPPFQLCLDAHVSCPSCFKYLKRCACGMGFTTGPHLALDWLVEVMKLKCRHAMARNDDTNGSAESVGDNFAAGRGRNVGNFGGTLSDDINDCNDRWYTISELNDHYRSGCRKNVFTCPLPGCGHLGRTDTIVEHYEEAHGPIEEITAEDPLETNSITFKIDFSVERSESVVRKVFNGYFMFSPMAPRRKSTSRKQVAQLSLQNINPCDSLQYIYTTTMTAREATVKISLNAIPNV